LRPLRTAIGYRVVFAPQVRLLHVIQGGVVATTPAARDALMGALHAVLAEGETDVIQFPALPVESTLFRACQHLAGPTRRQYFARVTWRRQLVLPESFEAYLASRSHKTRFGIRYDAKRLESALGASLRVETMSQPATLERLVRQLDLVAHVSYQHGLGAGFTDTHENRELARLSLERGWLRAYLLSDGDRPIAYWLCSAYHGRLLLRRTGFDPAYAHLRPGIYLLMRVLADAIADPMIEAVDFGQGDAEYKRQFSGDSFAERELVFFAPTCRAVAINGVSTTVLGLALMARKVLDGAGLTDRVRSGWRGRLSRA
jgi:CelD/BcsL family acetyltransferase involved in cellulose biosynthesis